MMVIMKDGVVGVQFVGKGDGSKSDVEGDYIMKERVTFMNMLRGDNIMKSESEED